MLTYELKKSPGVPLYEALYRCIRDDILAGNLTPGQKLPSKRSLAQNLEISKITVEAAYGQLLSEGYIRAQEKVGFFVEDIPHAFSHKTFASTEVSPTTAAPLLDLTGSGTEKFPFSVWSKLQREVLLDLGEGLLLPLHNQGLPVLRSAIAAHLAQFRGMQVDPENILIGAGTDFLYNLLIQLLGRDKRYAVEEPGYGKIRRIYASAGAICVGAAMDTQGVDPRHLSDAQVLHISASHHFPTGIVTPLSRRLELLRWAHQVEDRWIIEDDYDSEFRFDAHPMAAMQSMDSEKVIYMNTFSKSLAPSIRISYMVLPRQLMKAYRARLGFYSCTVSGFEQYTLARFLSRGYFEKHINRMRKSYKALRNRLLSAIESCPVADHLTILEENAGLHFILKTDTALSGDDLVAYCEKLGLRVRCLRSYYQDGAPAFAEKSLVINYSGLTEEDLSRLEAILKKL